MGGGMNLWWGGNKNLVGRKSTGGWNCQVVDKLTTLSLYQKSLVHKEKQVNVNFNQNQINFCCINFNYYIQNKIKNKLFMKAINYASIKLEEKANRSAKKKKQFYQ